MPLVGNDIVDLKDQANAKKSTDLRYLKKILTDSEIDELRVSDNPEQALWCYWACKEAAYKVISKINSAAAFLPRRWSVCRRSHSDISGFSRLPAAENTSPSALKNIEGVVKIPPTNEIPFYIRSTSDYIHCIAADGLGALYRAIEHVDILPQDPAGTVHDPSMFVRSRLTCRLEALFHIVPGSLEIRRIKKNRVLQPPAVYLHEMQMDVDISLSHDGRFTAYAVLPGLHDISV